MTRGVHSQWWWTTRPGPATARPGRIRRLSHVLLAGASVFFLTLAVHSSATSAVAPAGIVTLDLAINQLGETDPAFPPNTDVTLSGCGDDTTFTLPAYSVSGPHPILPVTANAGTRCTVSHTLGEPQNSYQSDTGQGTADISGEIGQPPPVLVKGQLNGDCEGTCPTSATFTTPASGQSVAVVFTDNYTNTNSDQSTVPVTVYASVLGTYTSVPSEYPSPPVPFAYSLLCNDKTFTVPPLSTMVAGNSNNDSPAGTPQAASATVEVPFGASCTLTELSPPGSPQVSAQTGISFDSARLAPPTSGTAVSFVANDQYYNNTYEEDSVAVAFQNSYPRAATITQSAFDASGGKSITRPKATATARVNLKCGTSSSTLELGPDDSTTVWVPTAAGTSCQATEDATDDLFTGTPLAPGVSNVVDGVVVPGYPAFGGSPHPDSTSSGVTSTLSFDLATAGPTNIGFTDVLTSDSSKMTPMVVSLAVDGVPGAQSFSGENYSLTCDGQSIAIPPLETLGAQAGSDPGADMERVVGPLSNGDGGFDACLHLRRPVEVPPRVCPPECRHRHLRRVHDEDDFRTGTSRLESIAVRC